MMNYGGQYPPPGYVIRPRANNQAIKWTLVVLGLFLSLLAGLLTIKYIGYATGPSALAIGMLFGMLPVPVYVLLILWIDRYESEPLWLLAATFLWGATFSAFISIVINSQVADSLAESYGGLWGMYYAVLYSAPLTEEVAKGLILFILFFWKKDEFDGIIDGIVYAGMVGLGFAMTENFKYYGEAAVRGGDYLSNLFMLRGAMSPFAHPLFTAMTGIGLGWARQTRYMAIKVLMPVLGFLVAVFLHHTWNRSALYGSFYSVYWLFMVPIFAGAIVAIFYALRREQSIVRYYLWHDCHRGLFTPEEYYRLCSVRRRMDASLKAFSNGGFQLWRTRMRFNQVASELAFHRSRVQRGMLTDPHAAYERERAYVNHLFELRRQLGPH
jgi:protease PrsW